MKELNIILGIIYVAGVVASYAEQHAIRWTRPEAAERIAAALLWPLNVLYVSYQIIVWIIKREG